MGIFNRRGGELSARQGEAFDKLDALAEVRGMEPQTLLGIMVRVFSRQRPIYNLDDTVGFGKYHGERMEDIVRADPSYVRWIADNAEGIELEDDVMALLEKIELAQQESRRAHRQ